jgi:phage terminase large subunit
VSSSTLQIGTARAFKPLLVPARYKGARGGRGSGKSHFFGELAVEDALRFPGETGGEGLRMVCIREVQKDLAQSSKQLVEDKIRTCGLGQADGFRVWKDRIETPKDGIIIFKGMRDYTAESVKSLEGFKRAWIDEAQALSARSLSLLRPTIHRWDGAEIWASWNPTRKSDAIDDFFRGPKGLPKGAICVEANWRDNSFWTDSAEEERQLELRLYPERYPHTYDGEYARAFEGAYFAKLLSLAKAQGRIGKVSADPLLPIRAFHDIGGSGANADAYTIWIVQWVGQEIRILDYYEAVGQVLAHHVNWMRYRGYENAIIYLPHDGVNENNVTGKRYEDHWRDAGFKVEPPVKNQGRGAASMRIEAVRRLGPKIWWNEDTTEAGRDAVGFYHEKRDENRSIGLGPEHDWSSHAADSLGLMAVCYEEPGRSADFNRKIAYPDQGYA